MKHRRHRASLGLAYKTPATFALNVSFARRTSPARAIAVDALQNRLQAHRALVVARNAGPFGKNSVRHATVRTYAGAGAAPSGRHSV